jgi:hypothetical protein
MPWKERDVVYFLPSSTVKIKQAPQTSTSPKPARPTLKGMKSNVFLWADRIVRFCLVASLWYACRYARLLEAHKWCPRKALTHDQNACVRSRRVPSADATTQHDKQFASPQYAPRITTPYTQVRQSSQATACILKTRRACTPHTQQKTEMSHWKAPGLPRLPL